MPKVPFWIFILLAVLYFSATRVDTMDVDASQYAEMSREMARSGDYLHLYDRGHDYLDKPPLLFWTSAASMTVFGANNFGYRFPSILFALWALYAVYRLAKLLYNKETGQIAALVLGACQGMFLMTNDVRCDTILMSCVVTAIWLLKEWDVSRRAGYFFGGCTAIALGMMAKGPIALMVPMFCFGTDWALKREWRKFFNPLYIPGLLLIAVLLLPMSIGLYQQYDLHPVKLVDGEHGVSGLRFFFWEQSFGRITGHNKWHNGADITFLLQSMLWEFLPWMFLFLPALFINVRMLVRQRLRLQPGQEGLTTGGFILTYLSLGISQYQLPHYIYIAFPLAAVMTAKLVHDLMSGHYSKLYKFMLPFQTVVAALLFVGSLLLVAFVFPAGIAGIALWLLSLVVWLYIATRKNLRWKLLWISAGSIMLVNVFVTNHFYYQLLQYQLGGQAGRYMKEQNIQGQDVLTYKVDDEMNSLPFYAQTLIPRRFDTAYVPGKKYILTMDRGLKELHDSSYTVIYTNECFKVSTLTPEFLSPGTRKGELKRYNLLKRVEGK